MRSMPDNSVDSIVTDPPYELGFMGKSWDDSGIAYDVGVWREALRVSKPGGHLLAFGGSRTYHRLARAVEDAGFEIRDQIMWIYGSGFNKIGYIKNEDGSHVMQGFGGSLKPAHEPIVMARKPLVGSIPENMRVHGTGAMNIDECRVPAPEGLTSGGQLSPKNRNTYAQDKWTRDWDKPRSQEHPKGRWPANIIHDGSDEVLAGFPITSSNSGTPFKSQKAGQNTYGKYNAHEYDGFYGDTGSAARFFYCAKASKADRDEGLDAFPATRLPNEGYGSIQQPKLDRAAPRENWTPHAQRNTHPTVKPTDLMRYLCRLVTPPGGMVRTFGRPIRFRS
jgi:site-specific DNA-methyltransferase (adenine-specific)